MVSMCSPRRTRWFVLISRFMRCQLCLGPVCSAPIKPWHVCNSASARLGCYEQYRDKACCDGSSRKSHFQSQSRRVCCAEFMETTTETIGFYNRITMKVTSRASSKTKFSLLRCLLLLLALLRVANGIIADSRVLVDQGQRAFQNGAFSQAAADWQKAVESFRGEGNTNAEILTSVSLASAYQSIGQQRRAVQILEDAIARVDRKSVV